MTYTGIGLMVVAGAVLVDLFVVRTRMVTRKVFWVSYAIVLFFQLLTNGVLTGLEVFRYDPQMILGWRVLNQPVEDLLMGFALVLLTDSLWIYWGRRGVQRTPMSGPPLWRRSVPASTNGAKPGGTGDGEPPA